MDCSISTALACSSPLEPRTTRIGSDWLCASRRSAGPPDHGAQIQTWRDTFAKETVPTGNPSARDTPSAAPQSVVVVEEQVKEELLAADDQIKGC
jgi:hypothetical protein